MGKIRFPRTIFKKSGEGAELGVTVKIRHFFFLDFSDLNSDPC